MSTTMTTASTTTDPTRSIDSAAGVEPDAIWMLNTLMAVRARAEDTGGLYSVLEQWVTPEGNPPFHVHEREDEGFLVLEGTIDVILTDAVIHLGPGGFAFAPRGVPHTYAVTSERARLVEIMTPGGAERFFCEVGTPAASMTIPEPTVPDFPAVLNIAARHGISVLPPPGA
jgi:mannose-6-phosphate isomerase-like protein (cupin superfamily)